MLPHPDNPNTQERYEKKATPMDQFYQRNNTKATQEGGIRSFKKLRSIKD